MSDAIRRAEAILRAACGDRVRTRYPLAPLTTFRIGGPAALYLEPESESDLLAAGEAVRETGIGVVVLGITLLGDLPASDDTGLIGRDYAEATASAGIGLWFELFGGILAVVAGLTRVIRPDD